MLFGNQNVLNSKIEMLTDMISKLTTQGDNQGKLFKPKISQGKGEVKEGLHIIKEVGSKVEIGQVLETDS